MAATRITMPVRAGLASLATGIVLAAALAGGATSASSGRSTTASSKDWTVTLWVARTSTRTGTTIPATLTIDNRTSTSLYAWGCPVDGTYIAYIHNAKATSAPFDGAVACESKLSPGVHVYRSTINTTYQICGGTGNSACGNPPTMRALPIGTYVTGVVLPNSVHALPQPKGISIVLRPASEARANTLTHPTACRAAQVSVSISYAPTPGGVLGTIWFGWVRYTNHGGACEMMSASVPARSEGGSPGHYRSLGPWSRLIVAGKPFILSHGQWAQGTLYIIARPPTSSTAGGECIAGVSAAGVEVRGPSSNWPPTFHSFGSHRPHACVFYIQDAGSGPLVRH